MKYNCIDPSQCYYRLRNFAQSFSTVMTPIAVAKRAFESARSDLRIDHHHPTAVKAHCWIFNRTLIVRCENAIFAVELHLRSKKRRGRSLPSATWGICTRRAGNLERARSRLYRSQNVQEKCVGKLSPRSTQYTYASLGEKNRIENEIMNMYTNKKYRTEKAE